MQVNLILSIFCFCTTLWQYCQYICLKETKQSKSKIKNTISITSLSEILLAQIIRVNHDSHNYHKNIPKITNSFQLTTMYEKHFHKLKSQYVHKFNSHLKYVCWIFEQHLFPNYWSPHKYSNAKALNFQIFKFFKVLSQLSIPRFISWTLNGESCALINIKNVSSFCVFKLAVELMSVKLMWSFPFCHNASASFQHSPATCQSFLVRKRCHVDM